MNRCNKQIGFTIVELMLAMGFVSALLLAIAMTVIQIGNIYNRGITYKNSNQVGGSIANELQRSISSVSSFKLADYFIDGDKGGRLCTGKYSYVWNYGKSVGTSDLYVKYSESDSNTPIYFVKISDSGNSICTKVGDEYPDVSKPAAIELIDSGQFNLAVHDFNVASYASDDATHQQLYSIEFVLGTNDQTAFDAGTTNCSTSGANANPVYCSVNRFNILARAGSATNQMEE